MAGRQWIQNLILGLLMIAQIPEAFAQRDPAQYVRRGNQQSQRPVLDLLIAGSGGPGLKGELLEQALTVTDSKLNWPPLPRAWNEYATTDYIQSNTSVGFKINPSLFGISAGVAAKMIFDFRYHLKSSFVLLVSRDSQGSQLFRPMGADMRLYINTSSERSLVGVCIFESQFTFDKGASGGTELFGSGTTVTRGQVRMITNTHFSQFFQISGDISVDQYEHTCQTTYRKKVQDEVIADFSRQIMSLVFHNHPQSQCKPDPDANPNENDSSCSKWFENNISPSMKNLTVARCELQSGGAHRCALKAKRADVACPLYWNRSEGVTGEPTKRSIAVSARGTGYPSFSCDKKLGLSCQVERQPWMLGNIPIRNGVGRCR